MVFTERFQEVVCLGVSYVDTDFIECCDCCGERFNVNMFNVILWKSSKNKSVSFYYRKILGCQVGKQLFQIFVFKFYFPTKIHTF